MINRPKLLDAAWQCSTLTRKSFRTWFPFEEVRIEIVHGQVFRMPLLKLSRNTVYIVELTLPDEILTHFCKYFCKHFPPHIGKLHIHVDRTHASFEIGKNICHMIVQELGIRTEVHIEEHL